MGIGIGLQRKGRDMSKLKYLIDGKADEQFENMLWCFGGGDPDSDDSGGGAAEDIVTMGRGAPSQGGNVSAREEIAMNQLIDDMDMEDRMAGIYGMDDRSGDRRLVNRDIENPMTTGFGPSAANPNVPANLFVGPPNLPPAVVTDLGGERFRTDDGQIIETATPYVGKSYDAAISEIMGGAYYRPGTVPAGSGSIAAGGAPTGMVPPSPAEVFRAQESQRAMGLDQRQAGYDAYQAMLNDAVGAAQSNIDNASGLLGGATKFMNQKFIDGMNTRIGGRDSEAYQLYLNDPNLFSPVYNAGGRLTGYRDEFGRLTGTDPLNQSFGNDDDGNDVVAPVANPMTGTERCPDGYTFDEDLQACRRKTKRELQADSGTGGGSSTASGDMFYRRTSLDDAPANLPSGFNFADANRNFTQSFAFRPGFYSNPMDTTGFTKLL